MTTMPLPPIVSTDRVCPAWIVGGLRVKCLMTAAETGGAFSLFEFVVPPHDPGPPPHTHTVEDESFYVLEGMFTTEVDGVVHTIGAGGTVFFPKGRPHGFRNETGSPVRVLMVTTPGGFEHFFDACGEPDPNPDAPVTDPHPPTEAAIRKILDAMPVYGMTAHV